jgi:hypothetical protein
LQYGGGEGTALALRLLRKKIGDITQAKAARIKKPSAIKIFFIASPIWTLISYPVIVVRFVAPSQAKNELPLPSRAERPFTHKGTKRQPEPRTSIYTACQLD